MDFSHIKVKIHVLDHAGSIGAVKVDKLLLAECRVAGHVQACAASAISMPTCWTCLGDKSGCTHAFCVL